MILFALYHLVLNQFGGYCIQVISLPIHVQYRSRVVRCADTYMLWHGPQNKSHVQPFA